MMGNPRHSEVEERSLKILLRFTSTVESLQPTCRVRRLQVHINFSIYYKSKLRQLRSFTHASNSSNNNHILFILIQTLMNVTEQMKLFYYAQHNVGTCPNSIYLLIKHLKFNDRLSLNNLISLIIIFIFLDIGSGIKEHKLICLAQY